jgi:sugar lactone lactonase YvrE
MTFDGAGNLYAADYSGNKVWRINTAGAASLITPLGVNPQDIALDPQGILLVSLTASGSVARVTQDGNVSGFASGLTSPGGIAFDTAGNLFVATGTTLSKIKPDGSMDQPIPGFDSALFIANRTAAVPEPSMIGGLWAMLFATRRRR